VIGRRKVHLMSKLSLHAAPASVAAGQSAASRFGPDRILASWSSCDPQLLPSPTGEILVRRAEGELDLCRRAAFRSAADAASGAGDPLMRSAPPGCRVAAAWEIAATPERHAWPM